MIHIMLSKNRKDIHNKQIIEWLRNNIQKENFEYSIKLCNSYLFDSEIKHIQHSDFIFWHPIIAGNNVEVVRSYPKSIVILEHQTILNEKISKVNPINEVTAVNNSFYIMYLDEDSKPSKEWKLSVKTESYLMEQSKILRILKSDKNNFKKDKQIIKDVFDDITDFTKRQINFE